jgi:hypothetical protein
MSADACTATRAWVSATRDGEAPPDPAAVGSARAHLAGCAGCARWAEEVDVLTRRARVHAFDTPDVTAGALAAWAGARRSPTARRRTIGRAITALAGAAGLALALACLSSSAAFGGPGLPHFGRDLCAMEAALALGLLLAAWRPEAYARGLLPVAAVAATLVLLPAARTGTAGRVDVVAELSHLAVLAGVLGLIVLLDAVRGTVPGARAHRGAP